MHLRAAVGPEGGHSRERNDGGGAILIPSFIICTRDSTKGYAPINKFHLPLGDANWTTTNRFHHLLKYFPTTVLQFYSYYM